MGALLLPPTPARLNVPMDRCSHVLHPLRPSSNPAGVTARESLTALQFDNSVTFAGIAGPLVHSHAECFLAPSPPRGVFPKCCFLHGRLLALSASTEQVGIFLCVVQGPACQFSNCCLKGASIFSFSVPFRSSVSIGRPELSL